MMKNLFKGRYSFIGFSCVFFVIMAFMPTLFSLLGLPRGGLTQLNMLNNIGIYAALALSLNIILGNAGLFNMGHTAFFAAGAYVTAILNTSFDWPILATLPLSGIVAAALAYIFVRPIIHLRGDYLLIVTIGIVEIVRIALMNNVFGLTGGANGLYGISRPTLFGIRFNSAQMLFYLIWGFTAITVVLFYLLENSRFGRALNYIKEDEVAAAGSGINVVHYKIVAFMVGAFWAGMVGTLFATNIRTIEPTSFGFYESVIVFAIVILGGSGSIAGVILGAFLLIGLQDVFREFADARMLIFGAAMMIMMVVRPQGLLSPRRRRYAAKNLVGKYPHGIEKHAETPDTAKEVTS